VVLEGPTVGVLRREPVLVGEGVELGCGLLREVAGQESSDLAELVVGEVEREEAKQLALEVGEGGGGHGAEYESGGVYAARGVRLAPGVCLRTLTNARLGSTALGDGDQVTIIGDTQAVETVQETYANGAPLA
jgi:hypothetical protein